MSSNSNKTNTSRFLWLPLIAVPALASALVVFLATGTSNRNAVVAIATAPQPIDSASADSHTEKGTQADSRTVTVSMAEMIALAEQALAATVADLDDYTTRLIKQEQDRNGVLQPASETFMKVATRHPGGKPGSPLKVYMRFDSPADVRGREVIWIEDQNDGNLLVREAGFIGTLGTVPLPPDGMLAMRGQRYPITEIGLTSLLEKLIQRGSEDRDNPDVQVFKKEGVRFDDRQLTQLRIQRRRPSGREGDFSIAELLLDRERNLVVSFRSFGWPAEKGGKAPLIESYEYHDLKLNVGLTDQDFDPANPQYTFAK